jgi:hypothetical protein
VTGSFCRIRRAPQRLVNHAGRKVAVMFPIDPRAGIQRAQSAAARPAAGAGGGFRLPGAAEQAARMSAAQPAMPMDALVALQAGEDATERRKRRVRRGHDLLDALDKLKAALLGGVLPLAQLASLKQQLDQRRDISDDPRLEEIVEHIELRVAVELAKLGR